MKNLNKAKYMLIKSGPLNLEISNLIGEAHLEKFI